MALFSVSGTCPICYDFFDDAVLCKDGFCYCRSCIIEWSEKHDGKWPSPITRQSYRGHPVLRTDVERNCLAREARRAAFMQAIEEHPEDPLKALEALAATHGHKPLILDSDCLKILSLNHPVLQESPYIFLAAAVRARCLDALPFDVLAKVLRLDRKNSTAPLLKLSIFTQLLSHCCTQLGRLESDGSAQEGYREAILSLREHVLWRASFADAVHVPLDRVLEKGEDKDFFAGYYFRDWNDLDGEMLVYLQGTGLENVRKYLLIPLRSDAERGTHEASVTTRLTLNKSAAQWPWGAAFSSEEPLEQNPRFWSEKRGLPPFPDSEGSLSEEEITFDVPTLSGCECLFEQLPKHLPSGFTHHPLLSCSEHVHELNALRLEVLDALSPPQTEVKKRRLS